MMQEGVSISEGLARIKHPSNIYWACFCQEPTRRWKLQQEIRLYYYLQQLIDRGLMSGHRVAPTSAYHELGSG